MAKADDRNLPKPLSLTYLTLTKAQPRLGKPFRLPARDPPAELLTQLLTGFSTCLSTLAGEQGGSQASSEWAASG